MRRCSSSILWSSTVSVSSTLVSLRPDQATPVQFSSGAGKILKQFPLSLVKSRGIKIWNFYRPMQISERKKK